MSIPDSILTALNIFYELFKALHKSNLEKFEKEWEEDVSKFIKALKEKDINTLVLLFSKYNSSL